MSKVQALTSHIKSKISKSASQSSCYSLYNATNNKTRDKIQFATPEDIQQAIQDASSAQERWHRDHTPAQRSEILQKASYILTGRSDEITAHEVKDTGRTISEIKSYDVPAASRCLSYYANMPSILSNGTYHDRSFFCVCEKRTNWCHCRNRCLELSFDECCCKIRSISKFWEFHVIQAVGIDSK